MTPRNQKPEADDWHAELNEAANILTMPVRIRYFRTTVPLASYGDTAPSLQFFAN